MGAALVAGLVVAANGGDVTASVGAALDTASASAPSETQVARGKAAAQEGDADEAESRLRLKRLKRKAEHELRCAVQSFGEVQEFFLRHPCTKLDQWLFLWSDPQGNLIVGSVVWVRMPSKSSAADLRRIEDRYGSGDITPLTTDVLEFGGIHFTGKHYKSRQDGSLVVVAETEPLRGSPSAAFLKDTADVFDVLPPP